MNAKILGNWPSFLSEPANLYAWILVALTLPIFTFYLLRTTSDGQLYDLGGLPILVAWTFFSKRYDFMRKNFKLSGGLPFRFRVFQHRIVAVTGPIARKEFFNNPGLDLLEGYRIFTGGAPRTEDVDVDVDLNLTDFVKRLSFLLRRERVVEILPLFLEDVHNRISEWGLEGMINPFKEINDRVIVRQSSRRKNGCALLVAQKNGTLAALLLPWIPTPSKKAGGMATIELYGYIMKYVQDRRAAGAGTNDPIDVLIQYGASDSIIVQTVLGIVFAAVINTGLNSCWALLYLGLHPAWRQRAILEFQSVVSRFCDPLSPGPLYERLSTIPLSVWEEDLPSVDLIIRETIRLSICGTFLRRNIGKDAEVQGVEIKKGDFLAYSAMDVHLNEDIYTDPEKFDPSRFEIGREEDKKVYSGYLGWGVGRHPCAGMRIAKLEIKIILAMVLLAYRYDVVDRNGVKMDCLPKPDRNDIQQLRPLGKPMYLKYTCRD